MTKNVKASINKLKAYIKNNKGSIFIKPAKQDDDTKSLITRIEELSK